MVWWSGGFLQSIIWLTLSREEYTPDSQTVSLKVYKAGLPVRESVGGAEATGAHRAQ
jgi:hypothetical protein